MNQSEITRACLDGCGRSVPEKEQEQPAGWSFLAIARRWRCPTCRDVLDGVNRPPAEAAQSESA